MKAVRYVWVLPFLVILYIYGSEALGVFTGNPEHYQILSGLGFSSHVTQLLTWASVFIEAAVIAAALWRPSLLTFSVVALWPWVPRVISAFTGGDVGLDDISMSFAASAAALIAYAAYARLATRTDATAR